MDGDDLTTARVWALLYQGDAFHRLAKAVELHLPAEHVESHRYESK
ncbi:MAG: hypothetical protein ACRDLD_02370 [Thermoleophilaceae bacterium]